MSLQDKIASAKPSTFLTDGLSEEEVKQAVDEGRKKVSDTVKLVIDFPKDKYKDFVACYYGNLNCDWLYKRVAEGIPLDDVKADIKKNILDEPVENGTNAEMACYNGGLLKCLEIIDNIGEGDSE